MRSIIAMLLIAVAGVAQAQDAAPATGSNRAMRMQKAQAKLDQRFDEADANHDGQISPDEAKAKMPRVSEHFGEIDSDHNGFVTRAEIGAFMQAKAAERRSNP